MKCCIVFFPSCSISSNRAIDTEGGAGKTLKKVVLIVMSISLVVLGISVTRQVDANEQTETIGQAIKRITDRRNPFQFNKKYSSSNPLKTYLTYYDLDDLPGRYRFGYLTAESIDIAVHYWRSVTQPQGTVYVLHGYHDHTGIMSPLIRFLLKRNWSVVAMDLPGHGLSGGPEADIDTFSTYRSCFRTVYKRMKPHVRKPYVFAGHSTGAAVLIDAALQVQKLDVQQLIVFAPLIHSSYWFVSKVGLPIADLFLEAISRSVPDVSHDANFLRFVREKDPLQSKEIPLSWVEALFEWNEEITEAAPNERLPVTVFQGTEDSVVDWDYNLPFLRDKFRTLSVQKIEGGRHHLLNETVRYRRKVFSTLRNILELVTRNRKE